MGLAYCFAFAFIAERFFGIADITGAYVAGIILCSINDSDYIERKVDINSYMLFGPVFFFNIGLKVDFSGITKEIIFFSIAFVILGMVSKIVGCGLISKCFKYSNNDALKIGIGMMTRGEVALIVSQKGLSVGLLDAKYFTCVILLILCSSVLTPIFLKILYSKEKSKVTSYGGNCRCKTAANNWQPGKCNSSRDCDCSTSDVYAIEKDDCWVKTEKVCSNDGYTKINNTYCYKIN